MQIVSSLVPLTVRLNDRTLTFQVDVRKAERAWFALGIRKSGSSIFSSIVNALALFNRVHTVDIPGEMFQHGFRYIDWNGYDRLPDLVWRGNVYIGFRDPPTILYGDPVFQQARKIFLVRDPRDALVSEYYSNAFSHSLPKSGSGTSVIKRERERARLTEIGDYALERVDHLNRTISGYRGLLDDPSVLVLKYEDVVFKKADWIARIASHYGWKVSDQLIDNILSWADVRPDTEDPNAFVRHVAPGDHLQKLSPAMIAQINGRLSSVWDSLGYKTGG